MADNRPRDYFGSAQKKLRRAFHLLETLGREQTQWESQNTAELWLELDESAGQFADYDLVCTLKAAEFPEDWALQFGEVIQNARSALDHAVYGLTRSVGDSTTQQSATQFPIITTKKSANSVAQLLSGQRVGVRHLAGTSFFEYIGAVQPVSQTVSRPSSHPLALLQELSNLDKHSELVPSQSVRLDYLLGHSLPIPTYPDLPRSPAQESYANRSVVLGAGAEVIGPLRPDVQLQDDEFWRVPIRLSAFPPQIEVLESPRPTITYGKKSRPADLNRVRDIVSFVSDVVKHLRLGERDLRAILDSRGGGDTPPAAQH